MLAEAAGVLAGWGLEVVNAGTPERRHLYLAGTDAERAEEFQRHYLDPEVRGLFLTRGGYGAARILPLLDGAAIAAVEPKPVAGFSDATALFAYLHAVAGISVLHGPCLAAPGFVRNPPPPEELEALRRAAFEPEQPPVFPVRMLGTAAAPAGGTVGQLVGQAVGRVVGGCLSVLVTTLGTPWEVDTRGALLFLEEINEAPYRIDRMITHLRAAGKFKNLRALVFGYLHGCEGEPPSLLNEVLRDLFREAPFPVAEGLPAGHGSPNLTLPLGQQAVLEPAPHGNESGNESGDERGDELSAGPGPPAGASARLRFL